MATLAVAALAAVGTLAAGVLFWSPAAAFACSGGPSAVNVYKECVPTGSESKPTSGAKSSGHATSSPGSTYPAVSPQAAKALEHAGKDRRRLAHLLGAYGTNRLPAASNSNTAATEPSALGSAFDLSSAPTALLITLAGTAVLLLIGSGLRVSRHRHRT
jgi:hypothetical protein